MYFSIADLVYLLFSANTVTALRLVSAITQQPLLSVTKHVEQSGTGWEGGENGQWIMDN
jgi:hypothetical protein